MNVYPAYLIVCNAAVKSEKIFNNFRRDNAYHTVVEGVPIELGAEYAFYIEAYYPYLLKYMNKFITNDNVGHPIKYNYSVFEKTISPVTVRYIKILGDLLELFGDLKEMDIVEIGVGYGGQCKIIHDYCKPKSYTIIDLPEVNKLSEKYLKHFGITNIKFKTPDDVLNESYSLCISNYAFAEFDRKYQDLYVDKVINKSDRGYMICNFFDKYIIKEHPDRLTKEEISKLKITGKVLPEEPQSIESNFLYVWNTK